MRTAIAVIAPNITLPIWARLFRASILPTVDAVHFMVGSPLPEMRELARAELGFAELDVRCEYQAHGAALNELVYGLRAGPGDVCMVVEDDCFVTCGPAYLERIWSQLPAYVVMGSRMAYREGDPEGKEGKVRVDTFGSGLYPNMAFAEVAALRNLDWRSRQGRDTGGMVGEELHAAGLHCALEAHLPQCRLSEYPGCVQVVPEQWDGPWLHVGTMSLQPRWKLTPGGGRFVEAMAAYGAALERPEVEDGARVQLFRKHLDWARAHWSEASLAYLDRCMGLMRRVYSGSPGGI